MRSRIFLGPLRTGKRPPRSQVLWARRLAAAMSLLILAGSMGFPAAAQGSEIHISSLQDWESFAENCRLDSWSREKTVILDRDLELSSGEPVPTFGGTFEGGGHTISGLELTGEGNYRALFRYIQEGGTVRDLNVAGTVTASGECRAAGGIAGVNRGAITQCTFTGRVEGKLGAGGIAGINEATGRITGCRVSGSVTGEHYTGGIVGENYGSLISCVNEAHVNIQEETASPELDSINWLDLNSTENIPACTDSGGIAGYSKGIMQSCVNHGDVGYPHTGYNVGGVAGRQAGYADGCVNYGLIQGRKEVGGVIGQMEPYTQLRYEEDTLQSLLDELDVLSGLLNDTLYDTDASRHRIYDYLASIGKLTNSAREDISGMMDDVGAFGEGTIDTVNELSARISRVLEQSGPVLDDLSAFSERLSDAITKAEAAMATLESASGDTQAAMRELKDALVDLEQASASRGKAMDELTQAIAILRDAISGGNETEIREAVDNALGHFQAALDYLNAAGGSTASAIGHVQTALPHLESAQGIFLEASKQLRSSMDSLAEAADLMSSATAGISQITKELAEQPTLVFPKLDSSYYEKEDRLNTTLDSLSTEISNMGQETEQAGDTFSQDLKRINSQFGVITNLLRDALNEDPTDTEHVIDVSDEDSSSMTWGKASGCTNYGAVKGDVNVGGLVGAMAIEVDFDPEDDVAGQRTSSTAFQYLTRAVLRDGKNYGEVSARNDCAGGVVGRMDLGMVVGCGGYGGVESTGGEYVGGIAGASYAVIRGSWAKCTLTGPRYVGGIAGFGTDIYDSGAMVRIEGGLSCCGAIAGDAEGTLSGNRFVGPELGGVDGISYSEKAEPVSYESFVGRSGVPAEFSSFTVLFVSGDETVGRLTVTYGQALPEERFPAVPEREGFFGRWEEFENDSVRFDAVVEAQYTPWLTVLSEPGGRLLAEGVFTPSTKLILSEGTVPPPSVGEKETLEGLWHVELSDRTEGFTALRLKRPEDSGSVSVLAYSDGKWAELPSEKDGSFLRVELTGSQAEICLISRPVAKGPWLGLACGGGALLLFAVIIRVKAKAPKGKHQK